jgi:hypothetical protein
MWGCVFVFEILPTGSRGGFRQAAFALVCPQFALRIKEASAAVASKFVCVWTGKPASYVVFGIITESTVNRLRPRA